MMRTSILNHVSFLINMFSEVSIHFSLFFKLSNTSLSACKFMGQSFPACSGVTPK